MGIDLFLRGKLREVLSNQKAKNEREKKKEINFPRNI